MKHSKNEAVYFACKPSFLIEKCSKLVALVGRSISRLLQAVFVVRPNSVGCVIDGTSSVNVSSICSVPTSHFGSIL